MTNHERIEGMSESIQELEGLILQFGYSLEERYKLDKNEETKLILDNYMEHFGITKHKYGKIE